MTGPSSTSAGGTRVVLPAPGAAVTTSARRSRTRPAIASRWASIGSGSSITLDVIIIAYALPRHARRRHRRRADDEGIEFAVPPAVRGAGRTRAGERDGGRAAAEAAAPGGIRAHPPGAWRAMFWRAARRQ